MTQSSDAMTMQDVTKIPYRLWACMWMVLAVWMSSIGVFLVLETQEKERSKRGSGHNNVVMEDSHEDLPLTTELT